MNERIKDGMEMDGRTQDIREIIDIVAENTLRTRPQCKVFYQPFCEIAGVRFAESLANLVVDLNQTFPGAKEGDAVYVDFDIRTMQDYEIYLNILGDVKVWFRGRHVFTCYEGTPDRQTDFAYGHFNIPISVSAGDRNDVRVKCVKHHGAFGFSFILSIHRYPGMWANDYIYACRPNLPIEALKGEEGVALSNLYHTGQSGLEALEGADAEVLEYAWPRPPASGGEFDFQELCGRGDVAYVYTVAQTEHVLALSGNVDAVFVNGTPAAAPVRANAGDELLIRCVRNGESWRLSLGNENRYFLPFLTSERKCGDRAVWLGPFYGNKLHPPECGIDFSKVWHSERGEKLYWRFRDNSRLRIYLDSVFYGQWFYALMVGYYGIRRAGQTLKRLDYQALFCDNMLFLAQYFDYITYDAACAGMPAFMPRAIDIHDLDNIGTMGMNLIDAYFDCNDTRLLPLIDRLREYLQKRVPRFPDGTFCRVQTMWADDVYMSCPFLVRLGRLTGDIFWFQEAVRQIRGFKRRLFIEERQVFSHIFFVKEEKANRIPWGRGNGWIFWSLTEMLAYLPPGSLFDEMLELFRNFAGGIRRLQDASGLWHQVLDRRDEGSYLETSCTAMFLLGFVRGIRSGWLDQSYLPAARAAWNGLMRHSVDREGNVYGVCMGSGCAMEASYYYAIPTIANDDHGTGVILTAASEFLELMEAAGPEDK